MGIRTPAQTTAETGHSDERRLAMGGQGFSDNRSSTGIQLQQQQSMANSPHTAQLKSLQQTMAHAVQRVETTPNQTGMPDNLKNGIESLSGMSMDGVRVHYNSSKPAQLNAHAYAQGTDIHIAPGQEQHLPHEAWHVVQQAQGRVRPTMQMKAGVPVNDDEGLEHEADVMGAKASAIQREEKPGVQQVDIKTLPEEQAKSYMIACYEKGSFEPPEVDGRGTLQLKPVKSAYDGGELFSVSSSDLDTGTATNSTTREYVNNPKTFKPTFVQFNYLFAGTKQTSIKNTLVYSVDNPQSTLSYSSGSFYDAGHKLASQNGGLGDDNDWVFPQNPSLNQGNSRLLSPAEKSSSEKSYPKWREHEQYFHDEVKKNGYGVWWIEFQ